MTKFFVQLLLPVILGMGAAMGLNSEVRADLYDTLSQAKASLHETVGAAIKHANKATANIGTSVLVKINTGASSKNDSAKADLKLKNDLKAKMNAGDASPASLLPGLSVNHSLTSGAQTDLEANGSSLGIGFEEKNKSTLNLDLGSRR